jgi:hypothetical protein
MRPTKLLPYLLLAAAAAACGDNTNAPDAFVRHDGANVNPDAPIDSPATLDDAAVDAAPGVDAPMLDAMTPTMSRVWAVGDWKTNNVDKAGAFADGATLPVVPATLVPGGAADKLATGTGYTVGANFDATPDGTKIAFTADSTVAGRYDLWVAAGDGSTPTMLVQGMTAIEIADLAISPDGSKVAYRADSAALNNAYDLYVVATAGGGNPVKVSPARTAGSVAAQQNVSRFYSWSKDSKYLAFTGDLTKDTFEQAYAVDTTAAVPAAVELVKQNEIGVQAAGIQGLRDVPLFDANDNIIFRARLTAGNVAFALYTATPAGVRTPLAVAPKRADASDADIGPFAITPNGASIVFTADAPTILGYNLFASPLANPTPTNLTNLAAAGHPSFFAPLTISPDGTKVAFLANFKSATRDEPYVAKLDGTDSHRLVSVAASCPGCTSPDAIAFGWTVDSLGLYVTGDLTVNNDAKLYKVDPTTTDQLPTLAVDVATSGDMTSIVVRPM